jgi:molybdate transport system substrate-binding protein
VHIAVAQNFAETAKRIGEAFAKASGHSALFSAGSTGKLYAQIEGGAPFEVFLSADSERPVLLEKNGLAVGGSRFTYARGRLVLWSADPDLVDPQGDVLALRSWRHLAVANPRIAPYGAAARQVLVNRGLWAGLGDRLVQGEDIGQTFQFVATGNAQLGFVALSQLVARDGGSRWLVPAELHAPLDQQAVLLERGRDAPECAAFLEFLRSADARAMIEAAGYEVGSAQ